MREKAFLLGFLVSLPLLAGCMAGDDAGESSDEAPPPEPMPSSVFVHTGQGQVLAPSALPPAPGNLTTVTYAVGQQGPEPSIGVTSNGYVFFQAMERTMRSADHGRTWWRQVGPLTATGTSDPYLWVDPDTDRVFQVNMGLPYGGRGPILLGNQTPVSVSNTALFCSHIAWSDDFGVTWLANPVNCGPVPFNDHEKLATGPWVGDLAPLATNGPYPNAVYYAYNKVTASPVTSPLVPALVWNVAERGPGGFMAVSFDGGASFPLLTKMFDPNNACAGSLHGAITAAPDGTVYVPARWCPAPLVAYSRDNGRTFQTIMVGESVGVPEQQKNPEIAVDAENNVYLTWVGKDNRVHLSISRDGATTWSDPMAVSPPQVGSAIWPTAAAGSVGRVGFAYIGTEESREGPWAAANETRWHLYYTYSTNALDADPVFVTVRATDDEDPVQRGSICVSSSQCKDGNRNLLDFIDLSLDSEGRPYVAYADGCTTPQCLGPGATHLDSRAREGYTMVLLEGPSLLEENGWLTPF